ncbi:hypothetical protein EDC94DRAFT_616027 [Helicostylum pulchrum]|nr:hypothetical protein EDC94DRAFT_616027 [Helicostylum pulchrum]
MCFQYSKQMKTRPTKGNVYIHIYLYIMVIWYQNQRLGVALFVKACLHIILFGKPFFFFLIL